MSGRLAERGCGAKGLAGSRQGRGEKEPAQQVSVKRLLLSFGFAPHPHAHTPTLFHTAQRWDGVGGVWGASLVQVLESESVYFSGLISVWLTLQSTGGVFRDGVWEGEGSMFFTVMGIGTRVLHVCNTNLDS